MKAYMIRKKNADMNEGRGPMIIDLFFLNREHAIEYMDAQPGVFGRKFKWSKNVHDDWDMIEIEILEYSVFEAKARKEALRKQALEKLTPEEREALGIKR